MGLEVSEFQNEINAEFTLTHTESEGPKIFPVASLLFRLDASLASQTSRVQNQTLLTALNLLLAPSQPAVHNPAPQAWCHLPHPEPNPSPGLLLLCEVLPCPPHLRRPPLSKPSSSVTALTFHLGLPLLLPPYNLLPSQHGLVTSLLRTAAEKLTKMSTARRIKLRLLIDA